MGRRGHGGSAAGLAERLPGCAVELARDDRGAAGATPFRRGAPPESNFATCGSLLAHEFVHVIEAHEFGPDGRDAQLWAPEDEAAAEARGQCIVTPAGTFQPLPGLPMPGERQYSENVADYGGIRLAHEALARLLGKSVRAPNGSGSTAEQRFFYRYAQSWCAAQTDADLRQSLAADGHAPAAFRVNGPLSNLPAFSRAFGCRAPSPMARSANRCRVW